MSHLGFVAPPFLGHLNPMLALAAAVKARGHRATVFGMHDIAEAVARRGVDFVPLGRRSHPPGTLAGIADRMAAPGGLGLFRIMRDMSALTLMYGRELPEACRTGRVDGIVADQLEPGGALAASHLGLPCVTVANALPIRRDPLVPPPFVGWRYDPSPRGLARNRGGYRVADLMLRPVSSTIRREAARLGVTHGSLEGCLSRLADITQMVPALDFPRAQHPVQVHPCGPLRGAEEGNAESLLGDGRRLVFASLGTLQGGRLALFQRIAAACQRLDLHLVIAHGGRLSAAAAASLPGRPTVRAFVPQRALLRHAALAITNGGLNTVLDAAAAGVPMLVIPIAFEQGAISARVEYAGVGRALSRRWLGPRRLDAAMRDLLGNDSFRVRAQALSQSITAAGGAERAASIIDDVLRTGRPVPDESRPRAALEPA